MILKTYRLKDYDFMLIVFTLLLSVIGVFAISSAMGEAGADNVKKQIGGIIVGTVFMIVISLIDYHFIQNFVQYFSDSRARLDPQNCRYFSPCDSQFLNRHGRILSQN